MSSNYISSSIPHFFRKNGGLILSCLSALGVVGTAYLSGVAAVKTEDELETIGKDAPIIDKAKALAPIYILPVAAGAATILCIFGANVVDRKQQASAIAAGAIIGKTFKTYKNKAEEIFGEKVVETNLAKDAPDDLDFEDGKKLFYYNYLEDGELPDKGYEAYFNVSPEKAWSAKYELNRIFRFRCAGGNGYVTLNEFLDLLDHEPVEGGDNLGWSEELAQEYYGYIWIDVEFDEVELADGMKCTIITTPFPPTCLA